MKIYLAGPMRGIAEFNFPAFAEAAAALRGAGHVVFSPAEADNEHHGVDISKGNATGDEEIASQQHGLTIRAALGRDMDYICAEAEAIALLPGWEKSKGATAEHATAVALGLQVMELDGKPPVQAIAISTEYSAKIDKVMELVRQELVRARMRYGSFRGAHEGYGVILEELDEMWDEIKLNHRDAAAKEAIQVAAMAASFVADLCILPS